VQAALGIGATPAAAKAALAAVGIGEPWLVPPRLPLTEAETAQLRERLTALDVL
jgi:dihydrodipicolinate synthase/N-acetylneuraminate lyase